MRDLIGLKSGLVSETVVKTATSHPNMVVAVNFIINIALSDKGGITEETLANVQEKFKKGTVITTRTTGRIFENSKDGSLFGSCLPLPERDVCKYGHSNRVVIQLEFANGNKKTLNKQATEKYWAEILGLPSDVSPRDVNFNFKYNIVNMEGVKCRADFENALVANTLKAIELRVPVGEEMFEVHTDTYRSNEKGDVTAVNIIPNVTSVVGLGKLVGLGKKMIGCAPSQEVLDLADKPENSDAYDLIRKAIKQKPAGEGTSRSAKKNRAARAAVEAAKEGSSKVSSDSSELAELKAKLAAALAENKKLEEALCSTADDDALWGDDEDEDDIPSLC